MTPQELLEILESLGSIDAKLLKKIRAQVKDPDRTVKTKAVLGYLVRKEQLTEDQAKQLLRGEIPAVASHHTDELMAGVAEEPGHEEPAYEEELVYEDPVEAIPLAKPIADGELAAYEEPEAMDGLEAVEELDPVEEIPAYGDADAGFGVGDFGAAGAEAAAQSGKATYGGKIDRGDQWNSKWPYIGFGLLGLLLIVGMFLWFTVNNIEPDAMYQHAKDLYDQGSYQSAINAFDDYIEKAPGHKNIKEAKARRVQSVLRDSFESKQWEETLIRARTRLSEYAEDEDAAMEKIRDDLGVMLTSSLAELSTVMVKNTDRAAMEANLAKAKGFQGELVDNVFYVTSSSRKVPTNKKNIDRLENNIRTIEGFIKKEEDYSVALVTIKELGDQGQTEQAFKTFQDLTRRHGDLAARAELRELMVKTSEIESQLIKSAEVELTPTTNPLPSPVVMTKVLGAIVGEPDEGLRADVIPTLVDGSVYGFNAGSGEIVWRRFVGLAATIQPRLIEDNQSVLVADAANKELLKLETLSGEMVWRVPIGETFFEPAVTAEKMIVTTASGKLLRIDPATGQLIGSAQLPQGANAGGSISESSPLIYQAGLKSNLYVIGTEDMQCKEVFYLGHYEGSISVPPFLYNGHLIVLVNGGDYCDMFVLRPKENGMQLGPDPVQVVRRVTNGAVTRHLQRYGRWLLVVSDRGEMVILEYNQGEDVAPISKFASESFESKEGQPSFIETDGSNLWVCGSGAAYYKVKRNLGKFSLKVLKHGADSFVAPSVKLDDKLFHVRKRFGSGMISASLVDAETLDQIWRNDFGGELAGPVIHADGKQFAVSSQGDLFDVSPGQGGSTAALLSKASTVVENLKFSQASQVGEDVWVVVGGKGAREFASINTSRGDLRLLNYSAPSDNPSIEPVVVGEQLVVANSNGQVAAIDPATGGVLGEAFLPPVLPGKEVKWIRPVPISENQFVIATQAGKDSGASKSTVYMLAVEKGRSVKSVASLESAGQFVGQLASDGESVYAAERVDGVDSLVKLDTAGIEQGRAKLDGLIVDGPWATRFGVVLLLDSDQLLLLDGSLGERWAYDMNNVRLACGPLAIGEQLAIVRQNGSLSFLDPASGEQQANGLQLGQPIVHPPTFADGKVFFSGIDGTVHVLQDGS